MSRAIENRLNALERFKPVTWQPPYVVIWPVDHEQQASCQQEIDAREATGQMVIVIRRAGSEL